MYDLFCCRQKKKTEDKLTVSIKVLFFEISAKMESICANSSQTGFVLIDHYSPKLGEWREKSEGSAKNRESLVLYPSSS